MEVKNWLSIVALTFTLFAGSYGAIKVFATNERVDLVQLRLEQKIVADQIWYVQQQLNQLEDKYRDVPCGSQWGQKDRERYRRLRFDLEQLDKSGG